MTRTCSFVAAALTAALASPAAAQPATARADNLRHQIYLMEGALARAVNFGAATLNQEIRAVMPDMLVLAGESTARGFHLDGYGVFFDVEVPVLRQSMMWSLRTMLDQDQQGATEALMALRRVVASTSARSGRRRKRRYGGSKPRSARSERSNVDRTAPRPAWSTPPATRRPSRPTRPARE